MLKQQDYGRKITAIVCWRLAVYVNKISKFILYLQCGLPLKNLYKTIFIGIFILFLFLNSLFILLYSFIFFIFKKYNLKQKKFYIIIIENIIPLKLLLVLHKQERN